DRYLMDRVANERLELRQIPLPAPRGEGGRRPGEGRSGKKLTYIEQREYEQMEQTLLDAEERLAAARRRAEDPAIATDAATLQERFAELAAAQAEVDRLYARWGELEAKVSS